jgi:hypothetical protein
MKVSRYAMSGGASSIPVSTFFGETLGIQGPKWLVLFLAPLSASFTVNYSNICQ